ncbi:TetR/AcrR family transcriptional regulator [Pontibacter sp. G13]|uniref:TetR/AcrR family transcriptional regulator n=1 Tax=Pontibacter sp. G13 TaxID=3074898 RepID=UPI00288ACD55|nr:TetR/AcrR family transcriptional regulator [Pontibacter sp. G13]WNJ20328.1 TetR/AcrR family transcriptional regulator [Pontibacter sp. G13]
MPRTKAFDEQEVLTKAMELFWKQGYHATSMQDLVDHLGINRASIYSTFGDKHALFQRAFDYYRNVNGIAMQDCLHQHPTVKEGIRALFSKAIDQSISDPDRKGCFVINASSELVPGDEELRSLIAQNHAQFKGMFQSYLELGESKGEFPAGKDLVTIAGLIFSLYNGIQVVAKVHANRDQLLLQVDSILSLLD